MGSKNWFEEWFNSPYYHLLYSNRNDAEAELFIKQIAGFLNIQQAAKVLDVACGKGRHSKTLAKLGFEVTGIDLSENSIAEAKQSACETLHFDVWDMRKAYKPGGFDFVFNLFSSFGYFDDEREDYACINAFAENLTPRGTLVIDYINSEVAVKGMKPREIIQRGETQFHIQKRLENGFIKKKIEFLAQGEDYSFEEQLKVINQFRFNQMLSSAGFTIQHTFGDYALNKFEPSSSPRLIMVAQKL
ncbi:MAG: methyltransferase domain-containing protein [Chitinophagales bacterium]|nr:methyltransferase domain-containing protein [Chitinophagales bacterium]